MDWFFRIPANQTGKFRLSLDQPEQDLLLTALESFLQILCKKNSFRSPVSLLKLMLEAFQLTHIPSQLMTNRLQIIPILPVLEGKPGEPAGKFIYRLQYFSLTVQHFPVIIITPGPPQR